MSVSGLSWTGCHTWLYHCQSQHFASIGCWPVFSVDYHSIKHEILASQVAPGNAFVSIRSGCHISLSDNDAPRTRPRQDQLFWLEQRDVSMVFIAIAESV
jgi:hypothetical protein